MLQGLEEMAADMCVWLAGSQNGISALRLTSTVPSIPLYIVEAAIARARAAQLHSLGSMETNLTMVHLLLGLAFTSSDQSFDFNDSDSSAVASFCRLHECLLTPKEDKFLSAAIS